MKRRKVRSQFNEPSLVPLADMLTNTVGILVFILIFTVLTAGAAVIAKRLPMERETRVAKVQHYICAGNRVYPLRHESVDALIDQVDRILKPRPEPKVFADLEASAKAIGKLRQEDPYLRLTLTFDAIKGYQQSWLEGTITCEPKEENGLSARAAQEDGRSFLKVLTEQKPAETALVFWVKPDSINAFVQARDLAAQQGFSCNWHPKEKDEPITFTVGGGGGGPKSDDGKIIIRRQ